MLRCIFPQKWNNGRPQNVINCEEKLFVCREVTHLMFNRLWLVILLTLPFSLQAQEENAFVQGNNTFAFDLYGAVQADADGNLFLSPYSISQAVGMVYAGAAGETAAQIQTVMGFPEPDAVESGFAAVNASLTRRADEVPEDMAENPFALNIANGLWGQVGYPFNPDYLTTLESDYSATLQDMDFAQPEAATQEINAWVSEQTEDRIPTIVPDGAITPMTRLVLANAIYFNASWQFPFAPPQPGPFTLLDGATVDAPLITHTANYRHTITDRYTAVEVPYAAPGLGMVAVLPSDFETFEDNLDAATFTALVDELAFSGRVNLTMPTFEFSVDLPLGEQLRALGMTDAFQPDAADFSGITQTIEPFYLSDAFHKAFVKLDENGTEAAAATAMIMGTTSIDPNQPVEIRLDRPFIFAIYDRETGTVLFLGRVMNPVA
jgi:serpin B